MKKVFTISSLGLLMQQASAQAYTWSENAACIFYTHCTSCHFPGGPGPFSLIDYNSAFTARYAIKQALIDDYMPPWPPDVNYQTYAHERLIPQEQKDILIAWVDQGALEGNTALAPTPPSYSATGSQLSTIDFTGNIGNYTNAALQDDYRCFLIPTYFSTDQFISEIEVIPGTRSMVHHCLVYIDSDTAALQSLDAGDPGPGYTSFGGTGSSGSKLIGAYVPGSLPMKFPAGMGIKIPAGSYIVLQLHYPQGTNGETDSSTTVNLKYAGGSVREVSLDPILNHFTNISPSLIIPPMTEMDFVETYTIPSVTPLADNFTILGVAPHMHLVGTSIKAYAIKPGNDTVPLIDIPKWDFRWQGEYLFRQPLVLPEGTVLKAEAHYNNTSSNPLAPNPNNWVFAGEATDDEMMLVYFSYLYAFPGDQNIIVDTVTVKPMYNGCTFVGLEEQTELNGQVKLYPNPATNEVNFAFEQYQNSDIVIKVIDMSGRVVYNFYQENVPVGSFMKTIPLNEIPGGTYMVSITSNDGVHNKPLIVVK